MELITLYEQQGLMTAGVISDKKAKTSLPDNMVVIASLNALIISQHYDRCLSYDLSEFHGDNIADLEIYITSALVPRSSPGTVFVLCSFEIENSFHHYKVYTTAPNGYSVYIQYRNEFPDKFFFIGDTWAVQLAGLTRTDNNTDCCSCNDKLLNDIIADSRDLKDFIPGPTAGQPYIMYCERNKTWKQYIR